MTDDYSENIDWDLIYRVFHQPEKVAENIRSILGEVSGPVIFCGFPEVASYLSAHYSIVFVDYADAIVESSRTRYPEISTVIKSEITALLISNPAKHIVISGRLSAFWQTDTSYQQLADALLMYPRSQVLIDYFDSEEIVVGSQASFEGEQAQGQWDYQAINTVRLENLTIDKVTLALSYRLDAMDFSYTTQRAYFKKTSTEAWHNRVFKDYETSLLKGLLGNDPSFVIHMKSRLKK